MTEASTPDVSVALGAIAIAIGVLPVERRLRTVARGSGRIRKP